MKDSMMLSLVAFLMTLGIGFLIGSVTMMNHYTERLEGAGIERIDKYSIESPYMVSNWYVIVWKDGKK